jgi:hypothetical protein
MDKRTNWPLVGMGVAWTITLAGFVWNAAAANSNYSLRIDHIEAELSDLDSRLDLAETFRMDIRASLAEIKTDLLWIRQQLNDQSTN